MKRPVIIIAFIGLAIMAGYFVYFPTNPMDGASGRAIAKVSVPELTGVAARGEQAFNANCATCHGNNAAGKEGVAPPLVHKIYEPNHHGDVAFVLAAKQGVRQHHWPFGNMPAVPDVTDQEISDIIAYVRTLQRANGIY